MSFSGLYHSALANSLVEGSGVIRTVQRELTAFDSVDIDGAYTVIITCGPKQYIEITGDDNILPHIATKVEKGNLIIRTNRSFNTRSLLKISIIVEHLEKISASGANDISVSSLSDPSLTLDIEGSANIYASGKTRLLDASLAGSVDLNTRDLHARTVRIAISGAGDADVYASYKLITDISGAGDIRYYGNPLQIFKKIRGAGEIIKK
ncbi:head GIN domain-containing protein [Desulfonema ishimotonii]|uniref:head GIN domain-containing protein n=1 Tax=Desulfonema ishimotonii TaxID=45657 RepID=UPI00140D625C|nr:head GIN domain-containing protein [Desulfonema ishimotonii]